MEATRRGQFGGGFQNAGDDHGDGQIALGARGAGVYDQVRSAGILE